MLLTIIDTETTGLPTDPQADVIEIGAILYLVGVGTIAQISTLLPFANNPKERVNRIPDAAGLIMNSDLSDYLDSALGLIECWVNSSDYAIAHNAAFDKAMIQNSATLRASHISGDLVQALDDIEWLCTCSHFEWPLQTRPGQSLIDLALAHGIGVSSAHRALTDCQLLASLFDRMGDSLPEMIALAAEPRFTYKAVVSYDERDLAKQAGFHWDAPSKSWLREMSARQASNLDVKFLFLPK